MTNLFKRSIFVVLAAVAAIGLSGCATTGGDKQEVAKQKVILQVSDNDAKKWNLALSNAKNIQADLGKDKVDIELVAYGPGIGMLKLDSVVGTRIHEAMTSGVKVVACENTMIHGKLTKEDMLPAIEYVPAGVVELMKRQSEGYAYIRP